MANLNIARAVRFALVAASAASAGVYAPGALAQEAELEQIVVTGSRIQRQDFTSDSPIVSVEANALRETGTQSVEALLNQLPQFVPSLTTTSNNPSNGGQANIDLRGLGTNRNLVLMNGRRLPPANSDGTVDVNILPSALIERIEVVTGGASAVYGSDAIAGVTNFIINNRFEGVQADAGYATTDRGDGTEINYALTLGGNFAEDRGNAVFSVGYADRDEVLQGDRAFSRVALDVRKSGNTPLGSGTIEEGRFDSAANNRPTQLAMDTVFGRYGFAPGTVAFSRNLAFNDDGTLFSVGNGAPNSVINFLGDTSDPGFSPDAFSYNYAPPNLLSLPSTRYNLFSGAEYDVTDSVTVYGQALYTTYNSSTQLAAVPATGLSIPVTNPYIPADLAELLASRPNPNANFTFRKRMTAVGPRISDNDYQVYQFLGGLKGELADRYNWDIYGSTSKNTNTETLKNDLSLARFRALLNAPDGGASICGQFDVFGRDFSKIDSACADYIKVYFTNRTTVEMNTVEGTIGGDLFSMPAGAAQFSVGAAYRDEKYDFQPDYQVATGDLLGFNQQNPLKGSFDVTELFAELYLPLLDDAPFAQSLDVTLGARYSDYSTIDTTTSYKVEGNWQPIDMLRVRGSYQRAIRAPSIGELFSPANQNFPALYEDPCDALSSARTVGANADVASGGNDGIRDLCIAQGIPATDIDDYSYFFTQVETFGGGNPDLKEETADTFTIGVVFNSPFTQDWLSNMQLSVDYYSIELEDAIFSLPAGEILLSCYGYNGNNPGLDPNDPACRAINRITDSEGNPSDGSPWVPNSGTDNIGSLKTAGIDVQLNWGLDFGAIGQLNVNLLANYLDKYEIQYRPDLPSIDYTGTIGEAVGSAFPDYKLLLNLRYTYNAVDFGVRWRYLPSMDNKYASYDPTGALGVPSVNYFDANATWRLNDALSITVGGVNLTDEEPPLYTNYVQMNTDPSTYDVLGRRYFASVTAKF